MSTLYTHRYQTRPTQIGGRWPTIGEYVTAQHTRSANSDAPDPDWRPRFLTAREVGLPLPRYERTPYRVWEAIELRARSVPWFRIAERTGLPEQTVRSWIRRFATT